MRAKITLNVHQNIGVIARVGGGEKAKQLRVGGTGCNSHPDFATGEYQPRTGQVCGTPAENAPERRVYSGCDNREAPRALSHVLSVDVTHEGQRYGLGAVIKSL